MRITRRRRAEPTVPMAAMADVAFLLIIFFILASTFRKDRGMQVLPEAESAQTLPSKRLEVTVTKEREIFVDNAKVELEQLQPLLEQKLAETSVKEVTIKADEEILWGFGIKILNLIYASGGNIGIATQ